MTRYEVVLFSALGLTFLFVGIIMNHQIKRYYRDFYAEYKCNLWTATMMLALPLLFRGIFDGMRAYSPWWSWWTATDFRTASYNLMFFVLSTYIPILT